MSFRSPTWMLSKCKNYMSLGRRLMSDCKKSTYGTMDELASPAGNWQAMHSANQKKYALHLVIGIGTLMGTIAFGFANNLFEAFADIPDYPAEIDCYSTKEEEQPAPVDDKKKKK